MCEEIKTKKCSKCERELPATREYYRTHGKSKDGFVNTCRECRGLRFYTSETWVCPKCGRDLPFTKEFWKPNKAKANGHETSMCRDCWNNYYQVYFTESPEKRREKERKYRERNPEKYAVKLKRHKVKQRLEGKTTYKYRMERASSETLENIKKRDENPERKQYEKQRWQRRKGEKYNARARELNALHPERRRANVERRRAIEMGAKGDHTGEQFKQKYIYHGYKCYYCGKPFTINEITEDHRIPLSRGGTNWISNIVPACRSCNSSKGAKTESEYWLYLAMIKSRQDISFCC